MMFESGPHVLVFPFPAHGHMIPLLDFTAHIAAVGLTITVVVTPKNLPLLNPLLAAHPTSVAALVLPFPPHPAIPPGVENLFQLPVHSFRFMLHALGQLHDPLLRWFRTHPSPPVAIISDLFLGWTHHLARQLSIRRYVFCPTGALSFSIINSLWSDMHKRRNDDDENETTNFLKIPNSPFYPWWQLSPIYRSYVEGDPVSEFIKDSFRANALSHGIIINTFRELEEVYLDYLSKELGHERVWAIGPVLPPNYIGPANRGGSSSVSVTEIVRWLDKCGDGTVVYVCFGSQATLGKEQMEELAVGLEKSGVKFILAVKDGVVPAGFEERVVGDGRGVVIKGWAPQVVILRHKAVCAFLTHCGWNSTLESIINGVAMISWPMSADQFVNATLLENGAGVACRICEGGEGVIHSDKIAGVLSEAASGKWMKRRARVMELSRAAEDGVRGGGASFNNLHHFLVSKQEMNSEVDDDSWVSKIYKFMQFITSANTKSIPQVSIWVLCFIFSNPVEAGSDSDNDDFEYEDSDTKPRYERALVVILGYTAVTICLLICLHLRRKMCTRRDETTTTATAADHDVYITTSAMRKLDIRVIESFPEIIFPESDGKFQFTDCHICLEEFKQGDSLVVLPTCSHAYHKQCIHRWMATRNSCCPDCRHDYGFV